MAYFDAGTWSALTDRPRWAADYRSRDHLIPGGVKLDAASFTADADGKKFIPSGTPVINNGADLYRPAGLGDAAGAVFLTAFDVDDAAVTNDAVLYRPGSVVKENYLPGFDTMNADALAAVRARYVAMEGVA